MNIFGPRRFKREKDRKRVYGNSEDGYVADYERFTVDTADMGAASVVTSQDNRYDNIHYPVLDIDIEHHYMPSTTPGHGHLYFNVPMTWDVYCELLDVLAKAGIIEEGYAKVSKRKGYTAVRLPWVKKEY